MTVPSPFELPEAYNTITLDGIETPGLCTFKGGGSRKLKVEDQQAPGLGGAFSVCRGEELPTIDYEIHVWTQEQFTNGQTLAAKLRACQQSRPPTLLDLVDLAAAHNQIKRVIVLDLGRWQQVSIGRWFLPVTLKVWQRRKPIGGLPKEAETETQRQIKAAQAEGVELDARRERNREARLVARERGF